jgi:hypothetical protein
MNLSLMLSEIQNKAIDYLMKKILFNTRVSNEELFEYISEIDEQINSLIRSEFSALGLDITADIINKRYLDFSTRTVSAFNENLRSVYDYMSSYNSQGLSEVERRNIYDAYYRATGEKPVASRTNVITDTGEMISRYVGDKGQPFYYGVSEPKLSYRQLGRVGWNIDKSITTEAQFQRNLEKSNIVAKRWNSSGLPNSRHESSDGQIVLIDEPFMIVNDITGDEDALMFPLDFESGSPGNCANCMCTVTYLTARMAENEGFEV